MEANENTQNGGSDTLYGVDLIKEGDGLRSGLDYDGALKKYESAIEINPLYFKPYYKKGMIYYLQNNLDAAEEEWKKAWKLEWQK